MAGDWQVVALEDVADELTVGYVGSMATEYVDDGIPFLRSLNVEPLRINNNDLKFITPEFNRRIHKSRLTPGDVVIVRTGKPGACSVVPDWLTEANCSDLVIVRCGKKLNNRFLAYYINTVASGHVAAHLVGAVQQHFNVGSARTLQLNLPPLAEQEAIVAVLRALDDKIELNRRMNASLEAMARALFQSWFVDFDPVRAKLYGRQPVGLDPDTASLFPAFFQETKVGYIPAGWQLGRLADLCNLKRGHDLPTSTRIAGPIPVISSSGTSGTHSETNVRGPGVVTGRYGTIGKVFYVEKDYWPLNTTLFVDDFKGNPPRFIFHVVGEVNFQNYTDKAAVPGVNRNHLHEEPTVLPPMELRQAFAHSVSPLWSQHAANERESRTLATLRDTLLPKLLSGEMILAEVDKEVFA
jgi:type I restriction enzyme S subunit